MHAGPLHGCLKRGNKPTYSQLNKTKKRPNIFFEETPIKSVETIGEIDIQSRNRHIERQRKLEELKQNRKHSYSSNNVTTQMQSIPQTNLNNVSTQKIENALSLVVNEKKENTEIAI